MLPQWLSCLLHVRQALTGTDENRYQIAGIGTNVRAGCCMCICSKPRPCCCQQRPLAGRHALLPHALLPTTSQTAVPKPATETADGPGGNPFERSGVNPLNPFAN